MTTRVHRLGWLLALGVLPVAVMGHDGTQARIADSEGGGRVAAASAGSFHGCGVNAHGGVDCWGANGNGQLDGMPNGTVGSASRAGPYVSVSTGDLHSCGLKADGSVTCWGRNGDGQLNGVPDAGVASASNAGPYLAVSTGSFHSCGLTPDGVVDCWGRNHHGQLDGTPSGSVSKASRNGPYLSVSAGNLHSCGVRADGIVDCWGRNLHGQLDGTPGSSNSASRVGPYLSVSAGNLHSCGVKADGVVDCWGRNPHGELNGTPGAPGSASRPGHYLSVSAGRYHSCALKADGGADCWGRNDEGQLDGTPASAVHSASKTGPYLEISAGLHQTCAIRMDGRTDCWGAGGSQAIGHPHYRQSAVAPSLAGTGGTAFGQISAGNAHTCQVLRDGTLSCWGSDTTGQAIPPPGLFAQVANGETHSCAIAGGDGSVTCWGADMPGTFGSPATSDRFRRLALGPQGISCGLKADGSAQCWHPVLGQTASFVGPYRALSVGGQQACAIRTSGTAECWMDDVATPLLGEWRDLQLGLAHACGVQTDGTLACWGDNSDGQTDNVPTGSFGALSVGYNHACAIRDDGTLACWGSNLSGQAEPPAGTYLQVAAGNTYTCAIRSDGVRMCWGDDTHGQAPQLVLDPTSLVAGQQGQAYAGQLTLVDAGRNADADYVPPSPAFALVDGALPGGMNLGVDGVLSGTPGTSGTFNFTVEAEDANGFVASRAYVLAIDGPATPTSTCASEGYTGTQLTWCRNICESGLSGRQLDTWIHRWINRYRDLPYCLVSPQ